MDSNPSVTCLCLTKDRREWLPKAIDYFLAQDYPNRELLIVADKLEDYDGLVPQDGRIRVIETGHRTVGEKRNIGCAHTDADLIAIADDDEYSAPGRLSSQVAHLVSSDKALTGYNAMKFTDGKDWWLYTGAKDFAIATSMLFKRLFWNDYKFQHVQCGQDEQLSYTAQGLRQIATQPDMNLMYATVHKGNTSPRPLRASSYKPLPGFEWRDG